MTIRELIKSEIDTLPDEALSAVRDFVRSQKEHAEAGGTRTRGRDIQWLQNPWKIDDFKPLTREEIYDRN